MESIRQKEEIIEGIEREIQLLQPRPLVPPTENEESVGNPPEQRRSNRTRPDLDFSGSRYGKAPVERRKEQPVIVPTVTDQIARHRERLKDATDRLNTEKTQLLQMDHDELGPIS